MPALVCARSIVLPLTTFTLLTCWFCSEWCIGQAMGQGRLDRARQEATEEEHEQPRSQRTNSHHHDHDDCNEQTLAGEVAGSILSGLVQGIFFSRSTQQTEDGNSVAVQPTYVYFPSYPYERSYCGYLTEHPVDSKEANQFWGDDHSLRTWSAYVSIDNGNDFSGLNRTGVRTSLDSSCGFGFSTNWNYFNERLNNGGHDSMVLGDTNLTWRLIEHARFDFRLGLGFWTLADSHTDEFGFNFTMNSNFYPCRPLVVSTVFDVGTVGSASIFHGRATVGAMLNRCEIFAGYDYINIGSVDLQGPLAGIRVWF